MKPVSRKLVPSNPSSERIFRVQVEKFQVPEMFLDSMDCQEPG